MKRAHPDLRARRELAHAPPHFVGGFVGERQRQNLISGHALGQQMRDAMRDDPRLPAPRPGQNQQRPLGMHHRLALRRIQRCC